jgi:hypothetical protein
MPRAQREDRRCEGAPGRGLAGGQQVDRGGQVLRADVGDRAEDVVFAECPLAEAALVRLLLHPDRDYVNARVSRLEG